MSKGTTRPSRFTIVVGTCMPASPLSTSRGSAPSGTPNASASECSGSVETASTLSPREASRAAVAAATVVLPTPPLPVNSTIRTRRA